MKQTMKSIFALIALMLVSIGASAQDEDYIEYDIVFNNVWTIMYPTNIDYEDFLMGDRASYDPKTNVLTLKNISLVGSWTINGSREAKYLDGLKIVIQGNCTIKYLKIYDVDVEIVGDGANSSLTVQECLRSENANSLTIKDCKVIVGEDVTCQKTKLVVDNSHLEGKKIYCDHLQLENTFVAFPTNASIEDGKLKLRGYNYYDDFVIGIGKLEDYPYDIVLYDHSTGKYIEVTDENKEDILGDESIRYWDYRHEVILRGANHPEIDVIVERKSPYRVPESLYFKIDIYRKDSQLRSVIVKDYDLEVNGYSVSDTLTLGDKGITCLDVSAGKDILISDLTLNLTGGSNIGILGNGESKLTVQNASVHIESQRATMDIAEYESKYVNIMTPDVRFDDIKGCFVDADRNFVANLDLRARSADMYEIEFLDMVGEYDDDLYEDYLDYPGSNYVTKSNCKDIFGDGTASYDPDNRILYLKNVNKPDYSLIIGDEEADEEQAARYDGIKVVLEGENSLASIYCMSNWSLCGTGILNLYTEDDNALDISGNLEISDCTINAKGKAIFRGDDYILDVNPTVTLKRATLNFEYSTENALCRNISQFVLEDCHLNDGAELVYDEEDEIFMVQKDGKPLYKGSIVPDESVISVPSLAAPSTAVRLYDLQGRPLLSPRSKSIYIKKGVDGKVVKGVR